MNKAIQPSLRKRIGLKYHQRLQRMLAEEHPLYQLFWECTLRCNLHCKHCGSDCRTLADTEDMPVADFLHVLDRVSTQYDPHKVFVIISGGEPLLRQDLSDCGQQIYDKGFAWGIVTNGMLLNAERFRQLRRAGLHSVSLSLDGLQQSHNWMRGNETCFSKALAAIDIMATEPLFAFDIVTCVTQKNINELPRMLDFLMEKGVKQWRLLTVFPAGRAVKNQELQLSPTQLLQLMDFIKTYRQTADIHLEFGCESFLGNYEFDVRDDAFFCKAGITVASVLADGSISACTSIRSNFHQGNIYFDDFLDVWNNRFEKYRNHNWMHKDECSKCKMWKYCNGNGMHLRNDDEKLLSCHYLTMSHRDSI